MNDTTARAFAPVVLRLGLAALYLWFGFSEVLNPEMWVSWVPTWASSITGLSAHSIVYINGGFEIALGAFLAIGIAVRWVALVLAVHMAVIVYEIGFDAIGVRDAALAAATIALSLGGSDWLTLEKQEDADRGLSSSDTIRR